MDGRGRRSFLSRVQLHVSEETCPVTLIELGLPLTIALALVHYLLLY